jgi:hypothetical protein
LAVFAAGLLGSKELKKSSPSKLMSNFLAFKFWGLSSFFCYPRKSPIEWLEFYYCKGLAVGRYFASSYYLYGVILVTLGYSVKNPFLLMSFFSSFSFSSTFYGIDYVVYVSPSACSALLAKSYLYLVRAAAL